MNDMPDLSALSWPHRAEIILVVGALVLLGLAPRLDRSRFAPALIGLLAAGTAIACGLQDTGANRLGLVVAGLAVVVGLLLLSSAELFDRRQTPEGASLLLIGGIGAVVLVTGTNLLELALGTEMISLVGAALVALGQGQRPLEAGFKYFVLTAVTFATLLFGMGLCFVATGSLDVPALGAAAEGLRPLAIVGVALFAIGLCFKLAVFPVHFGALDAYTAGPSSFVGAIMVLSKLGAAYALARLASGAGEVLQFPLMLVGLVTIAFAVLASFAQDDLRRLMAYSAVAHAGFLALGLGSAVDNAHTVGFYVVGYGAGALLMFACLAGTGTGPLPLSALKPGGSLQLGPARAIGMIVALLSLAGVPPLPGFWTKLAILKACFTQWGALATSIAALGGVLGVIYYLRPLPDLLAQTKETKGEGAVEALLAVGAVLAVVLVLGLVPGAMWDFVLPAPAVAGR
jgi:NADH-quinone oxidoreductase subunit N